MKVRKMVIKMSVTINAMKEAMRRAIDAEDFDEFQDRAYDVLCILLFEFWNGNDWTMEEFETMYNQGQLKLSELCKLVEREENGD